MDAFKPRPQGSWLKPVVTKKIIWEVSKGYICVPGILVAFVPIISKTVVPFEDNKQRLGRWYSQQPGGEGYLQLLLLVSATLRSLLVCSKEGINYTHDNTDASRMHCAK